MSDQHWHKWLSGEEWARMGPFPDEQACPYCRVEQAKARVKGLEEALTTALMRWCKCGGDGRVRVYSIRDEPGSRLESCEGCEDLQRVLRGEGK